MPILPDRKKMITTIMAGIGPKESEVHEVGPEPEVDNEIGLEAACEDIITAIETKDAKLLKSAMKDFHAMYDEEREQVEPGEESMEGLG